MPKISITQPIKRERGSNKSNQEQKTPLKEYIPKNSDVKMPMAKKLKKKSKTIQPDDYIALTDKNEFEIDEQQFDEVLKQLKEKKLKQQKEIIKEVKKQTSQDPNRQVYQNLPVYSAEELKIGMKGSGNTPLCPFDCDCCF